MRRVGGLWVAHGEGVANMPEKVEYGEGVISVAGFFSGCAGG